MRTATHEGGSDHQIVHRNFTIRWTRGCIYTRFIGPIRDDDPTRWQISSWARVLDEIIPQLPGDFCTINDTSVIGQVPRGLWRDIAELAHNMARKPLRRALVAAEGLAGDNHAEAAQLATAGYVRVFRVDQLEPMIEWLAEAGTIEAERLRHFLA